jgi:hypothetical protein
MHANSESYVADHRQQWLGQREREPEQRDRDGHHNRDIE